MIAIYLRYWFALFLWAHPRPHVPDGGELHEARRQVDNVAEH